MPYSIAVIDDDAQMLHQISSQLQEIAQKAGTSCAVHAFSSPMDLDELVYDAYFLDISMRRWTASRWRKAYGIAAA